MKTQAEIEHELLGIQSAAVPTEPAIGGEFYPSNRIKFFNGVRARMCGSITEPFRDKYKMVFTLKFQLKQLLWHLSEKLGIALYSVREFVSLCGIESLEQLTKALNTGHGERSTNESEIQL